MPEQTFVANATVTVDALVGDIWAVWVDVNGWTSWDDGIEKAELHGNFAVGNAFTLTPPEGDPIEAVLVSVAQGEEFIDEVAAPFGTIRTQHRLTPVGDLVSITHEVRAVIEADSAGFFGREIWPHLQRGLSTSLLNLADLVG